MRQISYIGPHWTLTQAARNVARLFEHDDLSIDLCNIRLVGIDHLDNADIFLIGSVGFC